MPKDASVIPVKKPKRESSHFVGLGPSEPIVMAPKQATPDMQPKLGVYGSGGNKSKGPSMNALLALLGPMIQSQSQQPNPASSAPQSMNGGMIPPAPPMGQSPMMPQGGLGPSMKKKPPILPNY